MTLKISIPATIGNFGPGFDVFGCSVDLYNDFYFEKSNKFEIKVSGEGEDLLTNPNQNLVIQSYNQIFKKLHKSPVAVKIFIKSRIPLKRGLGSSATGVLAGVLAARYFLNATVNDEELLLEATKIEGHPDNIIPAFYGGFCVCKYLAKEGRIFYRKIIPPKDLKLLFCIPDFCISTKKARKILPKKILLTKAVENLSNATLLLISLIQNNYKDLSFFFYDNFHQPYRGRLIPNLEKIFHNVLKNGALGIGISGSGPTLFVVIHKDFDTTKIENIFITNFKNKNINCKILNLSFTPYGAKIKTI